MLSLLSRVAVKRPISQNPLFLLTKKIPWAFYMSVDLKIYWPRFPSTEQFGCLWKIFLIVSSIMINTLKPERIIMMGDVCPRWKLEVVARCKTYTWQGEGLAMNRIERRVAKWRTWSWRGFFLSYFCLLIVRAGWF